MHAGRSLSSREEACLSDCAKRFIETTQVRCRACQLCWMSDMLNLGRKVWSYCCGGLTREDSLPYVGLMTCVACAVCYTALSGQGKLSVRILVGVPWPHMMDVPMDVVN